MEEVEVPIEGISKGRLLVFLSVSILAVISLPNIITGLLALAFWLRVLSSSFGWRKPQSGHSCSPVFWPVLEIQESNIGNHSVAVCGFDGTRGGQNFQVSGCHISSRADVVAVADYFMHGNSSHSLSVEARAGFFETVLLGSMWVTMMILGTYVVDTSTQKHRTQMIPTIGWAVLLASAILTLVARESTFFGGEVAWCLEIPTKSAIGGYLFFCWDS